MPVRDSDSLSFLMGFGSFSKTQKLIIHFLSCLASIRIDGRFWWKVHLRVSGISCSFFIQFTQWRKKKRGKLTSRLHTARRISSGPHFYETKDTIFFILIHISSPFLSFSLSACLFLFHVFETYISSSEKGEKAFEVFDKYCL